MDINRDNPRISVRILPDESPTLLPVIDPDPRDPKPLPRLCMNCISFTKINPSDVKGLCLWAPPPCLQEGTNQRKPVPVDQSYTCSAYEEKPSK